jgi:hypothetical protein
MTGNAMQVYVCSPWLRFARFIYRAFHVLTDRPQ